MHEPMQVFNPGCFEAQNIYEAERALTAEIGGAISVSVIRDDGCCRETTLHWYHYPPVEDDHRCSTTIRNAHWDNRSAASANLRGRMCHSFKV
jgi:hypothetical protein